MSNIRYYLGPFTSNNSFRLYHSHLLDPATKGKHIIRLPDRTLVWSDEYEQRLREYQSEVASLDSDK
jgi:hypothetical protein